MKRGILYICLILVTCPGPVNGQLIDGLGLKAGVSLSNQTIRFTPIEYTMETDPILEPAAALFLEAFRGRSFSMQADFAYITRGNTTTTRSVTVNHLDQDRITENKGDPVTSKFRYLSITPMIRARTELENIIPYALVGPRIDVHLSYSTDSDYPLEQINHLIVGLSFGIGVISDNRAFPDPGIFKDSQHFPEEVEIEHHIEQQAGNPDHQNVEPDRINLPVPQVFMGCIQLCPADP
jgi:hypothetical protein